MGEIRGYEGHVKCQVERGHDSVIVFIGVNKEGYQFLKIDAINSDGITKELRVQKVQAEFVSKTRRGHYIRLNNNSPRIYINSFVLDTGKLFQDICNL